MKKSLVQYHLEDCIERGMYRNELCASLESFAHCVVNFCAGENFVERDLRKMQIASEEIIKQYDNEGDKSMFGACLSRATGNSLISTLMKAKGMDDSHLVYAVFAACLRQACVDVIGLRPDRLAFFTAITHELLGDISKPYLVVS